MKITVISGSPHKKGTSAFLVDNFIEGATEAGHEIFRFDAAFKNISGCVGCGCCEMGFSNKTCIKKDDMQELYPQILASDLVVFATPIYYFSFSAQLKTVIDRFYAVNNKLMEQNKRAILLATAWNPNEDIMNHAKAQYLEILKYLGWQNEAMIFACGCGTREQIINTQYPQFAKTLGQQLK